MPIPCSIRLLCLGLLLISLVGGELAAQPIGRDASQDSLVLDSREYPRSALAPQLQLAQFPAPQHREGHTLLRLYNWVDLMYLAGRKQPGVSRDSQVVAYRALQAVLAERWHYLLQIHNAKMAQQADDLAACPPLLRATVELANEHPEWPLSVTTYWRQANLRLVQPDAEPRPYVRRQDLDTTYYLHNAQGERVNRNGRTTRQARFNALVPPETFEIDGQAQRVLLQRLSRWLTRPIDMINENGEVLPLPVKAGRRAQFPVLAAAFEASQPIEWHTWQSRRKLALRQAYAQTMLDLPALQHTRFSWYGVDGGPLDRFQWDISRHIHRPINGQYYATPDFYPRWPANWEKWRGAWRGWKWIEVSRRQELAAGDALFSPFVAAGWSADPTDNLRPSQWLGLLKVLGPIGAEFFYPGFFIESRSGKFDDLPRPEQYAWQLAMPAYAQAVTSWYEAELRQGQIPRDEAGRPRVRIYAGDPRLLVTARQRGDTFIIAGTVQPKDNRQGSVPDSLAGTIELGGQSLTLWFRRQGSVYRWHRDTDVWDQLDRWHEAGHPSWWSQRVTRTAAMYDTASHVSLVTQYPDDRAADDYRRWRTGLQATEAGAGATYVLSLSPERAPQRIRLQFRERIRRRAISLTVNGQRLRLRRAKGRTAMVADWPEGLDTKQARCHITWRRPGAVLTQIQID